VPLVDEDFEHLTLMADGTLEMVLYPVDLHENLIEVPAPMSERAHRLDPTSADLRREDGAKPVSPEPHCLMRDIDPSLVQQVFDIPQRQRVSDIHHHREADDLRRGLEVAKNAGARHGVEGTPTLPDRKSIFL
jgi:hypothetical protein